jgi:hypothetical protein
MEVIVDKGSVSAPKSKPAPVVHVIGHTDGMVVTKSDINIQFTLSEELDGIFINGRLATRSGKRYWCKVPIGWETTPVVISRVEAGKIQVLKTFGLRADEGESMVNPNGDGTIFIDNPDGQVIFAR